MSDGDAAMTAIARYYHLDCAGIDADIAMYRHFAVAGPVLDLGAGIGRVAAPLAAAGCAVVAVEPNEAMRAAGAARMAAARVDVIAADMRSLRLDRRFDLVICALSTFCHLQTRSEQLAALRAVACHLTPDGSAVIDLPALNAGDWELGPRPVVLEWTRHDPRSGRWVNKWATLEADPGSQTQRVTYLYDERTESGSVERTVAQFPLRHVFRFEMQGLLEAAGLMLVHVYGSYDLGSPEAGDRLIVVARAAPPSE